MWLIAATFAFTAIMVGVAVKLPDHVPPDYGFFRGWTYWISLAQISRGKSRTRLERVRIRTNQSVKLNSNSVRARLRLRRPAAWMFWW